MTEINFNHELPKSNLYKQTAEKISKSFIEKNKYSQLSEKYFQEKSIISPEETLTDFVFDQLRFGESLQDEAFNKLCQQVPPPIDTPEVNQWIGKKIFTNDQEEKIRTDNYESIEPKLLPKLINIIVSNASQLKINGDQTADPEPIKKDIDTLMKLLDSDPEILDIKNKKYWGIKIPQEAKSDSVISGLIAMMLTNNYKNMLVVTDPDINSKLSSLVFNDHELVSYFTEKNIRNIQSEAQSNLNWKFSKISFEKIDESYKNINILNHPVQIGFFNRLLNESKNDQIEIISIFRDRKDLEVFDQEKPYNPNRNASETSSTKFIVTRNDDKTLKFQWSTKWEHNDTKTFTALVKIEDNNLFFTKINSYNKSQQWMDKIDHDYTELKPIYDLFNRIEVVSLEDWFQYGNKIIPDIQQTIKTLDSCQSSVEFINKLKEFSTSNYPKIELIVNSGKKINYVVDKTTPPSKSSNLN